MKKLFNSFGYAIKGVGVAIKTQTNIRIHLLAVLVVTVTGIFLDLNAIEWAIIALTIGFVLTAEMFNTAIEHLVDFVSPEHHEKAGIIKDLSAGAVLVAAIVATVVAVYIFGNKFISVTM
jgi:diacylglycerol kinase